MTFRILSAPSIPKLEELVNQYDITTLGSLAISNSHYFVGIIGELRVVTPIEPEVTEVTQEPEKPKVKPKTRTKASAA